MERGLTFEHGIIQSLRVPGERQVLVCKSSNTHCWLVFDRSMILRTLWLYGTKAFEHVDLRSTFYYHLVIYLGPFDINNIFNLNSKYSCL